MQIEKQSLTQKSITLEDPMWDYIEGLASNYSKGRVKVNRNEVLRAIVREHMDNYKDEGE